MLLSNLSANSKKLPPLPAELKRRDRLSVLLGGMVFLTLLLTAGPAEISPVRLLAGLGRSAAFVARFFPPSLHFLPAFLYSLLQTLIMAFWGTFLATFLVLPLAFLGSKNVIRSPVVYLAVRGLMDILRGLNELVLALVFVAAIGLGPLPGIMALTLHTAGVAGKLLSEAIETVDMGQVEAVRATGSHPLLVLVYGFWPQVAPAFYSVTLYLFEVNVRSATVLGLVGAGGIGFDLMQTVRAFRFQDAATIILLILLTVFTIDKVSARIRQSLV
ncbi:phosphonate ABC transporter, permease protein PhnE [Synechococcus sp. H60.3]|uniref:phosphonate ABC transporter, permease protein PhnE n=1 Tax=Synechococcus sp. H60.3 TaxID=2967124 RepID=UPI0039C427A5